MTNALELFFDYPLYSVILHTKNYSDHYFAPVINGTVDNYILWFHLPH